MKFPWYKYEELELSKRNTLQIFITNRCNLKCDGCFARNAMAANDLDIEMPEYVNAVNIAMSKGAKQINILGGEPLLHPRLDAMCWYNKGQGIKTTVYTNGIGLGKYDYRYFHGAKIRVSLDSLTGTKKAVTNFVEGGKGMTGKIDANYMITSKSSPIELLHSANVLETYGCKVFFIFNMCELANKDQEFFDSSANKLVLPVLKYKKLVHEFLEMYNGNMEIHISKRGVFESTLSLPHNKCKFANYFIGGKIIQCPYDIINLKFYHDGEYEFDTRYCQQNSTCLMSKIKVQRRNNGK